MSCCSSTDSAADGVSAALLAAGGGGGSAAAAVPGSAAAAAPSAARSASATRWWILAVYSYATFVQSLMFNSWGPIAYAVELGFRWSDAELATVPNASNIGALVACFFSQYLVAKKGVRLPMLLATSAMFVAAGVWSLATGAHLNAAYELVLFGAVLNGLSYTVYAAIPTLISSLWFSLNQRTTATGIAMAASFFGDCMAFITGPLLVNKNVTGEHLNISDEDALAYQDSVARLMYLEMALSALCLVLLLIYFPGAPSTAPSKSAGEPRLDFLKGMRYIGRSKAFWTLNLAHNLPTGFFSAWSALMSLSLKSLEITEEECGWIGFSATFGSLATSICVTRLTDLFNLKMKAPLHLMTTAALVSYVVVALLAQGAIQVERSTSKVLLYTFCSIGASSINGMAPLYYELACDSCYPAHEGAVGASMTASSCFFGALFFIVFFAPVEGTAWMSWSLVSVLVVSLGLLTTLHEEHQRLDVDLDKLELNERHGRPTP